MLKKMSTPSNRSWRDDHCDDRAIDHDRNKNTSKVLIDGLNRFYNRKLHFDCKFSVGMQKKSFEAHKIILAMASQVFEGQLYNNTSAEPISIPDVDAEAFNSLLRYIYTNHLIYKHCQKSIINLWYATSKYEISDLSRELYSMIKINVTSWSIVYVSACRHFSLNAPSIHTQNDANTMISKCMKVISVKTNEALRDETFTNRYEMPSLYLKKVFSWEHMDIESEIDLFKILVEYAKKNGWQPNEKYFIDKKENGEELSTSFQERVREAMKQIRFLSMSMKDFDSLPAKSGFLTEFEVETIRNRIADDGAVCVSHAGFSKHTEKRYESLDLFFKENPPEDEDTNRQSLHFTVKFPCTTLGVTQSFNISNASWKIIIYKRNIFAREHEYTVYLKCDPPVSTIPKWKCFVQLDMEMQLKNENGRRFDNIPWYCFKCDALYSQIKPIKVESEVIDCAMKLTASQHNVSYKNAQSKVDATYGKCVHDYE